MQISGQFMLHVIIHHELTDKHDVKMEKDYVSYWQVKWDKKGDIWKLKLRISETAGNDLIISDLSGILSMKSENQVVFGFAPWLRQWAWISQSSFLWFDL